MQCTNALIREYLQASLIYLAIISAFLFTSCMGVGYMVGGSMQSFKGKYSIQLTNQYPDIFDTITAVGNSISLSTSNIDASNDIIIISNGELGVSEQLTGNRNVQVISVRSTDGGKHLDIDIQVQGNFGHGTKKAADDLFSEFKTSLLEKVN